MKSSWISASRIRWGGLALLLFGECLAFRLGFDIGTICAAAGWWGGLFGSVTPLHQVAIATVFAAMLIACCEPGTKAAVGRVLEEAGHDTRWPVWLAAHVASAGGIVAIALAVNRGHAQSVDGILLWTGGGFLLTTASLAAWFLALAPGRVWCEVLRARRRRWLLACVLGGAAVAAGHVSQNSWRRLSGLTLPVVERLLRTTHPQIISVPAQQVIGPPGFVAQITPQCSGYEGFGLICVYLAAFFCLNFRKLRFPEAWLLWPIGIAAIWLCNVVRIVSLVTVGRFWSRTVALRCFHSNVGWIAFNLLAVGLLAGVLKFSLMARAPRSRLGG